jgi:CXXC-20-CXXC protein
MKNPKCPNCNSEIKWYQTLQTTKLLYINCPNCKVTLEKSRATRYYYFFLIPISLLLGSIIGYLDHNKILSINVSVFFLFILLAIIILLFNKFWYRYKFKISEKIKMPADMKWYNPIKYKWLIIFLSPVILVGIARVCPNRVLLYYNNYIKDVNPNVYLYDKPIQIPNNWLLVTNDNDSWWYDILDCCDPIGRIIIETNEKRFKLFEKLFKKDKEETLKHFHVYEYSDSNIKIYITEPVDKLNDLKNNRFFIAYVSNNLIISSHLKLSDEFQKLKLLNSNINLSRIIDIILDYSHKQKMNK